MNKKNKILYVSHSSEIGGASRSLLYLASCFKDSCVVILPKRGPINRLYTDAGLNVKIIRVPTLYYTQYSRFSLVGIISFLYHFSGFVKLLIHVKNRNYKIIHFNEIVFAPVASLLKKIFRNKIKVVIHSRVVLPMGMTGFLNRWYKRLIRKLDFGIAIGFAELLSLPKKLPKKIIMNPVIFENYKPEYHKTNYLHEKFNIPSEKKIAGYFGVIHRGKGQEKLIDFLICNEIPNTFFILVGDGPLKHNLVKKASLTKNIAFLGKLESPYRVMEACDYIIRFEEHGLLGRDILEANALGVPILCYVKNKNMYSSMVKDSFNSVIIESLKSEDIFNGIVKINKISKFIRNNSVKYSYGFMRVDFYRKEVLTVYNFLL